MAVNTVAVRTLPWLFALALASDHAARLISEERKEILRMKE